MNRFRFVIALASLIGAWTTLSGCRETANSGQKGNNLKHMRTARLAIETTAIKAWIADSPSTREKGLMFVKSDQLQPLPDGALRGMLFVFPREEVLWFWMKDTYIPLDIAYVRSDGTIVKTYTMTPLETSSGKYSSRQPVRYALEVKGGLFAELGISEGDMLNIPPEVLNPPP